MHERVLLMEERVRADLERLEALKHGHTNIAKQDSQDATKKIDTLVDDDEAEGVELQQPQNSLERAVASALGLSVDARIAVNESEIDDERRNNYNGQSRKLDSIEEAAINEADDVSVRGNNDHDHDHETDPTTGEGGGLLSSALISLDEWALLVETDEKLKDSEYAVNSLFLRRFVGTQVL